MPGRGYVQFRGHRYTHVGAITEAFRAQVDVTLFEDDDTEHQLTESIRAKRDEWLREMPPRDRWWLIQSCLALAAEAALVQESRS